MSRKFLIAILLLLIATPFLTSAQKQAVSVDLLITDATIVTMDADRHIIENGALATKGDQSST